MRRLRASRATVALEARSARRVILDLIAATPDIALARSANGWRRNATCERCRQRCGCSSPSAASRTKKDGACSEQQRPDVKARREAWFDGQLDLEPEKLIFIDETSASTKMARLRGRAKRGKRCRAAIPHGHWKTTTSPPGCASTPWRRQC